MEERALRDPVNRVSPRAPWRWLVEAAAGSLLVVAVAVVLVGWRDELPWWLLVPLVAGCTAYTIAMPIWRYRVHRWEVTASAVYTQTGWWARERRIAPMSRIQTVDYAEDTFDRFFRLATVTITTASAAGALEIAGLDATRARGLAEELTRAADSVAGDAT